jgi:glycosyltransferase involved in cell wall biosynthesis
VDGFGCLGFMRVLYFTRDYTPHDHRFLSALQKTGHKIFYLRLERTGPQLEDRAIPSGVEQVSWTGGQHAARLKDSLGLVTDLKRVIRSIKPDLIQCGPLQTAAFLTAMTGFKPIVSMSWGYDLLQDARRNIFWEWATRFTLSRSAVMVGDCATVRQRARFYGMPDEAIITFPWGVDIEYFSPGDARAPGAGQGPILPGVDGIEKGFPPFVLLSTRGWEPIYGVEVIARAFVLAARQHPELDLFFLGNGSQAGLLRSIFLDGGVLDRVQFPGLISQVDLPRYYRAADLYISASHSDGTSISLLEAMACGRPALISDIPGNREWVTPGQEGWLFPDGSVEGLAEAIVGAVARRAELARMGQAARSLVEKRGNWENNFPKLLQAYDLAIKRKG